MWVKTHNHAVFTWFPQKMITNETCLTATTAEIKHCTANHDQNLFIPRMTNNFFRKFRTESDKTRWRWQPKALRKQVIRTGGSRALKPNKLKPSLKPVLNREATYTVPFQTRFHVNVLTWNIIFGAGDNQASDAKRLTKLPWGVKSIPEHHSQIRHSKNIVTSLRCG